MGVGDSWEEIVLLTVPVMKRNRLYIILTRHIIILTSLICPSSWVMPIAFMASMASSISLTDKGQRSNKSIQGTRLPQQPVKNIKQKLCVSVCCVLHINTKYAYVLDLPQNILVGIVSHTRPRTGCSNLVQKSVEC